jgi:hypothetical protein
VEFHVNDMSGKARVFKKFDEAASFAVSVAVAGRTVNLDVCIWSEKGARWWGGPDAVRDYKEDSEMNCAEMVILPDNSFLYLDLL